VCGVSRPISAAPRFSLFTAFAVIAAVLLAELVATWLVEKLYALGTIAGLFQGSIDDVAVDTVLLIVAKLLGTAVVAALFLLRGGERLRDTGTLRFAPASLALAWVPLVAGLIIALSEIDNVLRALLPPLLFERLDFAPDLGLLVSAAWSGPLLAVVVAPATEELVFRGLILRGLLGRWAPGPAIVISAALFALTHFNPAQAPVALLLGTLLGWVYVRTRSLGLCIVGHALNNAATYLESFPFEVTGFNAVTEVEGPVFHPWWFNGIALALLAGGIWHIHRRAPAAASWLLSPPAPPHRSRRPCSPRRSSPRPPLTHLAVVSPPPRPTLPPPWPPISPNL
jgi:membrane protease YdiL (CAAX protease family)